MRVRGLWVWGVLLGVACAHLPPEEARRPEVASLRIEGERAVPEEEILERLVTRERYEPTVWAADLQRIVRVFQRFGYDEARVTGHRETTLPDGRVALEVHVFEGEPVRISQLEIKGLDGLPPDERDEVLADLPLREGEILLEEDWARARPTVLRHLEDLGYAEAVVDGQARVFAAGHEAKVFLDVTPGRRYRFGATVVVTHPAPEIGVAPIVAAAQSVARPGERYSRADLDAVQKRVFELGVFDSVEVAPGPPDRERGQVAVLVDVSESPLHEVRLGGGLGLEPARNEVHVLAEYLDNSILGGVRRLRLHGIAGYAFVPDVVAVLSDDVAQAPQSAPFADGTLTLEQPQLLSPTLHGFASVEVQRGVEQAYRFFGAGLAAGVVWQPSEPLSLRFVYRFGWNRLDSPWPLTASQEALAYGCPDPCRLSSFEQVLQWDRRDNPIEPRRGYTLGVTVREAGGPLGGAGRLVQVSPQVRGYVTPDAAERWTLAGRLRFGVTAHAEGDPVPIFFRYFSGGAQAMRGFGYHRLSPLLVVPRDPDGANGVTIPVGGDGLLEGSLELRHRLGSKLTLAGFVDLGAVTHGRLSLAPSSLADALQWAVGVGARYATPLGPLRLDLAWRPPVGQALTVDQLPGQTLSYPTASGCFGLGSACALHLTFGEAF